MLPTRDSVKTIAALDEAGSTLRVVIATVSGGSANVTQTREMPASQASQLASMLDAAGVDLLVRVVKSGRTVARVVALPPGKDGVEPSPASTADALSLMAESDLPSTLPSYRRAAGALSIGRGAGSRVAMVTGWTQQAGESAWTTAWDGPQVGVAEIAALAALTNAASSSVGVILDAESGAVAILARAAEKVLVRTSRVASGAGAPEAAAKLVTETLGAAGVSSELKPVDLADGLQLVPAPDRVNLAGSSRDERWYSTFGLAAAACAIYADDSPVVHGLVNLHQHEPKAKPPVIVRVTRWFGVPVRAASIIGICLLSLVAIPLSVSYARMKSVEKTVTNETELLERNSKVEQELAFAKILEQKRWPMTKLLADVAGATPVGITLESCEIGVSEGVTIRGRSDSAALVTNFRENLGKLRIFDQVTTPSTSPVDGGVQFQLTAKVVAGRAIANAPPIDDFAAKTLSERLYGEAGKRSGQRSASSGDRRNTRTDRSRSASSSSSSRSGDPQRSSSSSSGSSSRSSGAAQAAKPADPPPPPISDAEIAKLNANQAMLQWTNRKKAAGVSGLDAATKVRLLEESEKAKARMTEARQQSSGGGGS